MIVNEFEFENYFSGSSIFLPYHKITESGGKWH